MYYGTGGKLYAKTGSWAQDYRHMGIIT